MRFLKLFILPAILAGCAADPVKEYQRQKDVTATNRAWCKAVNHESLTKYSGAAIDEACAQIFPAPEVPSQCKGL